MVKKKCPNCNQDSFSAAVSGKWNCPHCKTDITQVPSNDIELTTIPLEALLENHSCSGYSYGQNKRG